jgi:hypothetical protein
MIENLLSDAIPPRRLWYSPINLKTNAKSISKIVSFIIGFRRLIYFYQSWQICDMTHNLCDLTHNLCDSLFRCI